MKSQQQATKPVGAVMVVGGGIAGMQAALDLANSGYYVYLVEKTPAIGGTMAQFDKTFPTNDCAMCILSPKLVEVGAGSGNWPGQKKRPNMAVSKPGISWPPRPTWSLQGAPTAGIRS
jgi:monoamine oxidase